MCTIRKGWRSDDPKHTCRKGFSNSNRSSGTLGIWMTYILSTHDISLPLLYKLTGHKYYYVHILRKDNFAAEKGRVMLTQSGLYGELINTCTPSLAICSPNRERGFRDGTAQWNPHAKYIPYNGDPDNVVPEMQACYIRTVIILPITKIARQISERLEGNCALHSILLEHTIRKVFGYRDNEYFQKLTLHSL